MIIPTAYRDGHAAARLRDAEMADRYVAHTTFGDPLADDALSALRAHPGARGREWLRLGTEAGPDAIPDAPEAVRALFAELRRVPDWFDPDATLAGCQGFHRHSEMFLGAFVGAVLIEGFSTLISKSFATTGRLVDSGVSRLKQNNLHLVEIFMPGSLDHDGEGRRLAIRIRLVHARVRQMLDRSGEWDAEAWGRPLSAAHIAYANAAFSGLLLARARQLGVSLTAEERESFMLVWRMSGHLMGVPAAMLAATEAEAVRVQSVGAACEPPPDLESVILANGLINSAPIVAGITEPGARRALAAFIYRVSRALIGDARADALRYPPSRTFGVLAALRLRNRSDAWLGRIVPAWAGRRRAGQFQRMLDVSYQGREGISYRLPEHLHAERDRVP